MDRWDTQDGHSPFNSFLNSISPVSKEVVQIFDENSFPLFVEKKKFILKPGAKPEHFYFIVKGVVHGFIKEEGKQITTWINEENEIVGSIRTLGTDKLCEEYLQALEDCELIGFPIAITEYVFDNFPETNVIARRLWEHNYRGAEERAYLGRIPSAEKKYKRFIQSNPDLMNRVPLKYVASYLGMTVETLCRIRSRQKIN
ncbi:MAG: Crp/Fnr family transcriptional regulator [Ginsengibacter sp.]